MNKESSNLFTNLTPHIILDLAEESLDIRCSGICRPLNSYINRVYEIETENGDGLIIKFYRPGRWSPQALQEEHDFMLELAAHEIPVIPPLILQNGSTLGRLSEMLFAIFEKKGGRHVDEFTEDQWLEVGRLLARTHLVGEMHEAANRITLHPEISTREQVRFLAEGDFIPDENTAFFITAAENLIEETAPLFHGMKPIRLHGDCHIANLIYRPEESFYLIDFDDMSNGPAVQDAWMLLPDHPNRCLYEIDLFLEGYEMFRPFDRNELKLIEPLRAMRYIHFIAWCAHQADDGCGPPTPDWGTPSYWHKETLDLQKQLELIRKSLDSNHAPA